MKRIILLILSVILTFTFSFGTCFAQSSKPDIEATTGILIDARSGEVLWEKNSDVVMAPASMTKMMTAILTIENLDMSTEVTVDEEMASTGGSVIYMEIGEVFTVEQLLKAMLVGSENDCAVALAKTISGSVEDFCNCMNAKAKELGCKNTNFENPNGLDDSKHKSTAYDMALIAKELMKHEELRDIVKMSKYTLEKTNKSAKRVIQSTNRMLWDESTSINVNGKSRVPYEKYCIGVKTGYTDVAQGCLACCMNKNDTELISVVMHSSDLGRFADSITVLNWGFDNFTGYNVYEKGQEVGSIHVKGAKRGKIATYAKDYAGGVLKEGEDKSSIKCTVSYDKKVTIPKKKGDKVGVIKVTKNDKVVEEVDILLAEDAQEGLFGFIYSGKVAHPWQLAGFIILMLIVLFALVIVVLRIINKKKAKKRREAMKRKLEREKKYKAR